MPFRSIPILTSVLTFLGFAASVVALSPTVQILLLNVVVSLVSGVLWYWAKEVPNHKKTWTSACKTGVMALISGSIMVLFTVEIFIAQGYWHISTGLALVAGIGGESFILAFVAGLMKLLDKGTEIIYAKLIGKPMEHTITPDKGEKDE